MAAIPERIWNLMTPEEREQIEAIVQGWRYQPQIECPQCKANLGIRLSVKAGAVLIQDNVPVIPEKVEKAQQKHITESERAIIESAERTGLLKAFSAAVHVAKQGAIPTDINAFFLTFLRTSVAKARLPRAAIDRFRDEFTEGRLTFFGANGVLAVLVDDVIRTFLPLSYVAGARVSNIGGGTVGNARLPVDSRDLDVWVRGRYGYVPLSSENFLTEMRRRNIGDFCEFIQ